MCRADSYGSRVASMNPGRRALIAWLRADPARSQSRLADLLGVAQPSVSAWVRGTSRPVPVLRVALDVLTGIPAESWENARERRRRLALESLAHAARAGAP